MFKDIYQIDSSTIDCNLKFIHFQYSCILTSQVSIQFLCSTKLVIIVIIFLIKCLSYSKISANAISVSFIFCFYTFYLILETCQLIRENFVFLVIFDTCDVVYNWSISLLPPIVLDNLFG